MSNAFKDWKMGKPQVFILAGIAEISRGSRSDSDDHPRIGFSKHPHPGGCARRDVIAMCFHVLCDPLPGSKSWVVPNPGCSSLSRLDPGLISLIPDGIKKQTDKIESLKAMSFMTRKC
jgi:hypothetical protein